MKRQPRTPPTRRVRGPLLHEEKLPEMPSHTNTHISGNGFHGFFPAAPPPDGVGMLDAMARRFDETMGLAPARAAAMNRAVEQLAGLKDEAQRRRRVLDDLAVELGRYAVPHGC
jgi:hypothetical protein